MILPRRRVVGEVLGSIMWSGLGHVERRLGEGGGRVRQLESSWGIRVGILADVPGAQMPLVRIDLEAECVRNQ